MQYLFVGTIARIHRKMLVVSWASNLESHVLGAFRVNGDDEIKDWDMLCAELDAIFKFSPITDRCPGRHPT